MTAIHQPNLGSTFKTSVRLSMKPSIGWIVILALTRWTHLEMLHRSKRSVVRNILDDGVARSTVCAIDEGIEIASVARVEQLTQTFITNGDIGRNER